ncbi:MAG: Rrf2 family transcriptional regulator [Chlorobi bacterium]|nr:Rrf2 family transcriptional regulator [Chlorobiota bacterium]
MSASTKLSASVKALCYLAETYPVPQNSRIISEKIGVNASKLRQLLSLLNNGRIVKSEKGAAGGFRLTKSPKKIDLQEIYCAIEDRKAFDLHTNDSEKNLWRSAEINNFFLGLFAEIQVDIEKKMKKIKLSDLLQKVEIQSNYK